MTKFRNEGERFVIRSGQQVSGTQYVNVLLKDSPASTAGRIIVRDESRCEHTFTMCADCVDSWLVDYDVDFQRTSAGRELQAKIK